MYIRLTGDRGTMGVYKENYAFEIGKANVLQEGRDIAIIGTGSILGEVVRAARGLKRFSIEPTIVNMHTIKPLDTKILDELFSSHKLIVTVEEHFKVGGLGSAVAEYKSSLRNAPSQLMLGVLDEFPHAGSLNFILNYYGLTAPRMVEAITEKWKEF
jgi:transketolase